jgi:hypothetical protein
MTSLRTTAIVGLTAALLATAISPAASQQDDQCTDPRGNIIAQADVAKLWLPENIEVNARAIADLRHVFIGNEPLGRGLLSQTTTVELSVESVAALTAGPAPNEIVPVTISCNPFIVFDSGPKNAGDTSADNWDTCVTTCEAIEGRCLSGYGGYLAKGGNITCNASRRRCNETCARNNPG